jgi:hypothetical protein
MGLAATYLIFFDAVHFPDLLGSALISIDGRWFAEALGLLARQKRAGQKRGWELCVVKSGCCIFLLKQALMLYEHKC